MALNRNTPCPCGSGKKYKKCCALKNLPSLRPAGQTPEPNQPASPVEGEVVLFCIHAGPGFMGHRDPSAGVYADLEDFKMPPMHWFFTEVEFQRPDEDHTQLANWIAICETCFLNGGGSTRAALIGGDYVWPKEPDDLPPLIKPNLPGYNRNPDRELYQFDHAPCAYVGKNKTTML